MHLRMKLFCIQYEQLRFHMYYNARTRPVRYNIHINEDIIFGWKKIKNNTGGKPKGVSITSWVVLSDKLSSNPRNVVYNRLPALMISRIH